MGAIGERLRGRVLRWLFPGETMTTMDQERLRQGKIVLYRQYYDGEQAVRMTERQRAWLEQHEGKVRFAVNVSATVVDAVVERLRVTGFEAGAGSEALWDWWTANRMDAVQVETHQAAVRDGEAFVLTAWNNELGRPDFVFHARYVDRAAGGDGYGMWAEYETDAPGSAMWRATKQWVEQAEGGARMRRTVFYPDRVEKFARAGGEWREYRDPTDAGWPLPWVGRDGRALGIPVAHFRNPGLRSELADVIPLQDALNKAWLDILAASDSTGFRMFLLMGFVPTTDGREPAEDGSNVMHVAPGQMLATRKGPGQVDVKTIEPASLQPLLDVEERIVYRVAQVSDTPLSRFQFTRQVSAEGTLRQLDAPLIAKVELRQTLFGNAWEDMARQALLQAAAFGTGSVDADVTIRTVWAPAAVRDQAQEIANATGKRALGIPTEQVWSELGYDAQQIAAMMETPEAQARLAALRLTMGLGEMDQGH